MPQIRPLAIRSVVAHSKGVMRVPEVVEASPLGDEDVRQELRRLEDDGEVELFQVGDHTMVKAVGQLAEETNDRDGPRSDKQNDRANPVPVWKH
jgi:hypothetical protein